MFRVSLTVVTEVQATTAVQCPSSIVLAQCCLFNQIDVLSSMSRASFLPFPGCANFISFSTVSSKIIGTNLCFVIVEEICSVWNTVWSSHCISVFFRKRHDHLNERAWCNWWRRQQSINEGLCELTSFCLLTFYLSTFIALV